MSTLTDTDTWLLYSRVTRLGPIYLHQVAASFTPLRLVSTRTSFTYQACFPFCGIACISAITATVAVTDLKSPAGRHPAPDSSVHRHLQHRAKLGPGRSAQYRLFHLFERRPRNRHRDPNWHMPDAGLRSQRQRH